MRTHQAPHLVFLAVIVVLALLVAIGWVLTRPAQSVADVAVEPDRAPVQEAAPEPVVEGDESVIGPGTSPAARRARGEYAGPLEVIDGVGMCPAVARAFERMRSAAAPARIRLRITSGFRTRTHQARLYRELGPRWAARPGKTLHHDATELDIRMMPGSGNPVHRWLVANAGRFGFVQRYSWEPWHWGFVREC